MIENKRMEMNNGQNRDLWLSDLSAFPFLIDL